MPCRAMDERDHRFNGRSSSIPLPGSGLLANCERGDRICRRFAQDPVGLTQLTVLTLKLSDPIPLLAGQSRPEPVVALGLPYPIASRLTAAPDLHRDRLDRGPPAPMRPAVLLHHPNRPLPNLRPSRGRRMERQARLDHGPLRACGRQRLPCAQFVQVAPEDRGAAEMVLRPQHPRHPPQAVRPPQAEMQRADSQGCATSDAAGERRPARLQARRIDRLEV